MKWFLYLFPFTFDQPKILLLLGFLPLIFVWYIWQRKKIASSLQLSNAIPALASVKSFKKYFLHIPFVLRLISLASLIFALAKPVSTNSWTDTNVDGIDIIMAMDVSTSMLAKDFKPNRLESSKDVALEFIDNRKNDRFGLVIFSGEAFSQCPITTDHAIVKSFFDEVKTGTLVDGTAIGEGLATAVNRLKESKSKSKVVILLTDGVNNQGAVSPETAAEIAKQFNVRVYTIGVGTIGKAYAPVGLNSVTGELVFDYVDVKIDDKLLTQISKLTSGKYFRATNKSRLREVYAEIDRLEKTRFEVNEFRKRKDEYWIFALIAGITLLLEFVVNRLIVKKFI